MKDAEEIARGIADDFEGRKLTKGQTAVLGVRIMQALHEYGNEEYARGIGSKCDKHIRAWVCSGCGLEREKEADADGYRRGRSEADELFVLDVDCEFGSGCSKDRTCSGASHWLTVQQIEQRGFAERKTLIEQEFKRGVEEGYRRGVEEARKILRTQWSAGSAECLDKKHRPTCHYETAVYVNNRIEELQRGTGGGDNV